MGPNSQHLGRIDAVDALRGSALFGIFLLHSVTQFGIYNTPPSSGFLGRTDALVWAVSRTLFYGKAFAIFATMFGLSFFFILSGGLRRGEDVRGKFIWRLALLAAFGYLHGVFYSSDILLVLAILGVPLVFLWKLQTRTLVIGAAILLLEPSRLWRLYETLNSHWSTVTLLHEVLFARLISLYRNASLVQVVIANGSWGQLPRLLFNVESGRLWQMMGLFICGLLIGRSKFLESMNGIEFIAKRVLFFGIIGFITFFLLGRYVSLIPESSIQRHEVHELFSRYTSVAQTAIWFGGFLYAYQFDGARRYLSIFVPYGRMSLTNYVTQGFVMVPLFYGFGFGAYRFWGPTFSILVAILFFSVQLTFSYFWFERFRFGPFEWLWRVGTLRTWNVPLRKAVKTKAIGTIITVPQQLTSPD